jgi:photosystem II stability/assembly factor-like uncharacterized protein
MQVIRDSVLIAGGESGLDSFHIAEHSILRSTDGGHTWLEASSGISDSTLSIMCLAVEDSVAYVGTTRGVFYRTADLGNSWTPLLPPVPQNAFWYDLTVLHSSLLLLTSEGNPWLFRSSDHGSTWTAVDNGLPSSAMEYFVVGGDYLFLAKRHAGSGRVVRSSDLGNSWSVVDSTLAEVSPLRLLAADSVMVVQDRFDGLHRSTDFGTSWGEVAGSFQGGPVVSLYASGDTLLLGTATHGVYRSIDRGVTWGFRENGPATGGVASLAANASTLVAGMIPSYYFWGFPMAGLGVYRLDRQNWKTPPMSYPVNTACAGDGFLLAGTMGGGVFRSIDSGVSWEPVNTGLPSTYVDCVSSIDTFAYCGHGDYQPLSRARIVDFSWTDYSQALNSIPLVLIADSTQTYLGANPGVYRRPKNGAFWTGSWAGMGRLKTTDLVFSDSVLLAATAGGIFRSADRALYWQQSSTGMGGATPTSLAVYQNVVFAGTSSGMFCSTDHGLNWHPANEGLIPHTITDLIVVDTLVYAGTSMGVWFRPVREMAGTVDVQQPDPKPASFILEQNYPNPFNSQTTFTFRLPVRDLVHGDVYSILGQKIASIVDGWREAGTYRVSWNADGFPTGVYFFRLRAGSHSSFRKLLLIR